MNEKNKEINRLKRKIRQWEKVYAWETMVNRYRQRVPGVNLGPKPKVPVFEK